MTTVLTQQHHDEIVELVLNDPDRRNAMTVSMFDALDAALDGDEVRKARAIVLSGRGPALCAGFDLPAAIDEPELLETFIVRLSRIARAVRRTPAPVIAAAHGAAIAGGCALVSACDLIIADADARLGYPVHRIGLSPAVSYPTLASIIGPGPSRTLMMSGRLWTGREAYDAGFVTRLVDQPEDVPAAARKLAKTIAGHGPYAVRVTKAWLNELDGSLDDDRFEPVATATGHATQSDETAAMLAAFWAAKQKKG